MLAGSCTTEGDPIYLGQPGALAFTLREAESAPFQRQSPDPLAGGRKDGVGDRRQDRRQDRLAESRWRVLRFSPEDLDYRRLAHTQHGVVAVVGLVHAAVGDRDLLAHVADAVNDPANGLIFGSIGVDDVPADVARGPHVLHFYAIA